MTKHKADASSDPSDARGTDGGAASSAPDPAPAEAVPDPMPAMIPEILNTGIADEVAMENRQHVPSHWTLSTGSRVIVNWSDNAVQIDGSTYPGRSATLLD